MLRLLFPEGSIPKKLDDARVVPRAFDSSEILSCAQEAAHGDSEPWAVRKATLSWE
ncbi:hypothetical protein HUA74_40830 [Myxococcus sp. CA051A]|uniref:hypothetical protein n=1 Tax=unclassified Myxococcus TaxID=2648731 RepID=UPI00157AAF98|nr:MULTISPECIES: hypothetical protein [unclassified Myxococcus]NTX16787.1 hypothetical protein [Myxococcus sp. CA056]NTX41697.1 hypothetical protein [Myxococcus sp. CA033]NTX67016.1 hypothetical protein [Myxococcus sp. CA051A]